MHKISRSVLTIFAKALNLCEGNDVLSAKLILKTIFKNFLKTAIIVVACLCIGLAKSMLGSMPLYADKMEQQTYFILEGLLSGLMWWTNMGLISKLFGRKRLLFVSWSLFLFYSVISIIFNVLTFVKMQLISEEEPMFLMAYFAFVFSPWLILALSFKPRKPQTSKPES